MRVALVIVNYNTASDLRACLESVCREFPVVETVVVDNGSTDGSREMVKSEFPWARLVDNPGNPGYASACNRGIGATEEPYIFILNSDVEFTPQHMVCVKEDGSRTPGGLEAVLERMDETPDIGALGPMVLNSDGSVQMSCRRFPSMFENLVHGFLGDVWPGNPLTRSYQMKDMCRDRATDVDWVSGAAMLLRREAAQRVGGFDEDYFMYVEDVDICWRLREAGYRMVYDPALRLIHHIGRTSSQQSVRMLYHHHRSMFLFFRRRYRGWKGMLLMPLVLAGLAGRFVLSLLIQRTRASRERREGA
ncbi:MAG: glycosyltransferase family 2 protein [Actinobacteria bacterium]|nr:glycosyltransferase family 2 protein [Actinomycetota bacterium]